RFRGDLRDRRGNPQPINRRQLLRKSIPLQRGCSNLAAMAAYRFREVTQNVTLLPLAGLGERESGGRGDFSTATAIAETDLAPLHRRPQRPFRPIVRRLYAFHFEKGKQSLAVNIERGGQIPHFFVGVVQVRLCQGEQLLLQGNRFPK